jgi:hypothetical protein
MESVGFRNVRRKGGKTSTAIEKWKYCQYLFDDISRLYFLKLSVRFLIQTRHQAGSGIYGLRFANGGKTAEHLGVKYLI